jgi:pyridoxine/pyridoxamine 5'-phosphate oxidase
MKRALAIGLLLVGCSEGEHTNDVPRRYQKPSEHVAAAGTPRERDCAEVRARIGLFDIVPDRARGAGIRDEGSMKELAARTYEDPAVKTAVIELVRESGAAFYTPADSPEAAALDKKALAAHDALAKLCGLKPLP